MAKNFSIDARLILQLGRDSIKNHTTALTELVKNSYDSDASYVTLEINNDFIRVTDNGFGMTEDEIDKNWLVIGYSEKRKSRESQIGRRKTGEKGIGRIATDRLGKDLSLITQSEKDSIQGLQINWDDFDVDKTPINLINIQEIENPEFNKVPVNRNGKISGTELLISNLREPWKPEDIEELYGELSYFISPLTNSVSTEKEFKINLETTIDKTFSKTVQPAIIDLAEIELDASYDGKDEIIYTLKNIYNSKQTTKILKLQKLYKDIGTKEDLWKEKLHCGPFDLNLKLYVQKKDILSGSEITLLDLRNYLNNNAGVKIFRDGIVVKPYGFIKSTLGFDWLNLAEKKARNPAGVGRSSYSITPNQLVGSLSIKRDKNPNVKDSASREGLVENEAFEDFKNVCLGSVNLLESYRVEIFKKRESDPKKKPTTNDNVRLITRDLNDVRKELEKIQQYVEKAEGIKGNLHISSTINKVGKAIEQTEKTFEELLDEKRTLSGLATLGISSAVFGHETETAINDLKSAARNSMDYIDVDIIKAKEELEKAYKQAKLVAGWGSFALTRVEREKRIERRRKISKVVSDTIKQVEPAFLAKSITLEINLEDFYTKTFQMDIESIVLNLITNAYTFCLHQKRSRKIRIDVYKEVIKTNLGFVISVSDSGYGVPKEYLHRIFSPLFSTKIGGERKQNGTGLGLTIVKSIVDELDGEITVTRDKDLKGAKFRVWIPIKN